MWTKADLGVFWEGEGEEKETQQNSWGIAQFEQKSETNDRVANRIPPLKRTLT